MCLCLRLAALYFNPHIIKRKVSLSLCFQIFRIMNILDLIVTNQTKKEDMYCNYLIAYYHPVDKVLYNNLILY